MPINFVRQSTSRIGAVRRTPAHVAVIMDGNGRWAQRRGRDRSAGHLAGARATRRAVEAAASAGVRTLTLYAFSGDNWARPAAEVRALMRLFARYLAAEAARCAAQRIRLSVVGRRDRLDRALLAAIDRAEQATADAAGPEPHMHLRVAIDYSARHTITAAARALGAAHGAGPNGPGASDTNTAFAAALAAAMHDRTGPAPDVDLLVRTGGELRLSDFLLWECAYAELWFADVLWPDFTAAHLDQALAAYARRDRRYGRVAAGDAAADHADDPARRTA